MDGFKRRSLGGGVYYCFGVHQRYEQWQPDNFRQGWSRTCHAKYKEWEYFSFGVKLWANFPINACRSKNFISYELRGLFIQKKGNFDHACKASEKFLRLSPL